LGERKNDALLHYKLLETSGDIMEAPLSDHTQQLRSITELSGNKKKCHQWHVIRRHQVINTQSMMFQIDSHFLLRSLLNEKNENSQSNDRSSDLESE
jgi:hypothetical protein